MATPAAQQPDATNRPDAVQNLVGPNKYDAVLRMDLFPNMYEQHRGWKVGLHPDLTVRKQLDFTASVRIAPIGNFNVGKTWIIQRLCGMDTKAMTLPSGETMHTEGLSIKMHKLNDFELMFLDTAGLNSPVTNISSLGATLKNENKLRATGLEQQKAMNEMLEELRRQEMFIRHLAFDLAQVYLLVVQQVSHSDQMEILSLLEQCSAAQNKQVVVVHNLRKMTYDSFKNDRGADGKTYTERIRDVFCMDPIQENNVDGVIVPALFNAFGSEGNKLRHVFMTDESDPNNRNASVLKLIHMMIAQTTPKTGSILTDIGVTGTARASSLVRLPSGANVELRFHRERARFVAGIVSPTEQASEFVAKENAIAEAGLKAIQDMKDAALAKLKELSEADKTASELGSDTDDMKKARDAELQKQREVWEDLAGKFDAQLVVVSAATMVYQRDASTLTLLDSSTPAHKVTMRPVPLGMERARRGTEGVRHNVTRFRATVQGFPRWCTMVHLAMPGLVAGEVKRLQDLLFWNTEHVFTQKMSALADETLRLKFHVHILPMPTKQVQSLNRYGASSGGNAVAVNDGSDPSKPFSLQVCEAGQRQFPTIAAAKTDEEKAQATGEAKRIDIDLWTNIKDCELEVQPQVSYARGVLTIAVFAMLSDEENRLHGKTWGGNANGRVALQMDDNVASAAEADLATDADEDVGTRDPAPKPASPPAATPVS